MTLEFQFKHVSDPQPPPAPKYDGWRVKHKIEGGHQATPPKMPEVQPPLDALPLPMTKEIQLMSWDLMSRANPLVTKKKWTAVHYGHVAFTNNHGFGTEPGDGGPRANYVLMEDLSYELPVYVKSQYVCGGSFITGTAEGDYLICKSGIDGIDPDAPMPTFEQIITNHWFIYAVTVNDNFTQIDHFPQGGGGPVLIPFIFRGERRFKLSNFERWQADILPHPLKVYRV